MESFLHSRNIFGRNWCSNHTGNKLTFSLISLWINWLNISHNSSVLSSTARLLLVKIVKVSLFSNGFPVVDTWSSGFNLNLEFSLHSLHVDLQVKFTHSTDNNLFWLFVDVYSKSRILTLEFWQSFLEFSSSLGFRWFDR